MVYNELSKGGCGDYTETIIMATEPDEPDRWCEQPISHLKFSRKYHCIGGWREFDNYVLGNAACLCERHE